MSVLSSETEVDCSTVVPDPSDDAAKTSEESSPANSELIAYAVAIGQTSGYSPTAIAEMSKMYRWKNRFMLAPSIFRRYSKYYNQRNDYKISPD